MSAPRVQNDSLSILDLGDYSNAGCVPLDLKFSLREALVETAKVVASVA